MKIRTTYQIITPESAEHGDAAESGWHDEEGVVFDNVIEAMDFLEDHGVLEPSSDPFTPGRTWYNSVDAEVNFKTGEYTYYSYHLVDFTERQETLANIYITKLSGKSNDNNEADIKEFLDLLLEEFKDMSISDLSSEIGIYLNGKLADELEKHAMQAKKSTNTP